MISIHKLLLSLTLVASTVASATDCQTNCASSCTSRTIFGGTWTDPLCVGRCEIEKQVSCKLNVNGCSVWETLPEWRIGRQALREYGLVHSELTADACVRAVDFGETAAGIGQFGYKVVEESLKAAIQAAADINPLSLIVVAGVKHGAKCACQSALEDLDRLPAQSRNPLTDSGLYMNPAGTIFYDNGEGAYCGFVAAEHFELVSHDWDGAKSNIVPDIAFAGLRYDGGCKVKIPTGFFDVPGLPGIYFSNGEDAYCWVPAPRFVTGPVHEYSFNIYEHTSMRRDGACPGMN